MAIYHCSVKVVSRSSGRSSVGASAYRSGEKLYNERDGMTHDYTKKSGIEHQEIIVPDNAPEWAKNREKLWNTVELTERRKDSQLAREIEVALPNELSKDARIELVRDYVKDFTVKGMVADVAIHDKGDGNPHAHIMLTMRKLEQEGFGKKEREWNDKQYVEQWRENWSKHANRVLEKEGHQERIDHRSYAEQGIEIAPTKHEGHIVRAMESRGIKTEVGELNRQILEENKMIGLIDKQISIHERSLANERTRVNGVENRDNGTERGRAETVTDILIKPTERTHQVDSSRATDLDQQSKQGTRGLADGQKESSSERGTRQGTTQDNSRESQRDIQGYQARNERPEQEQQQQVGTNPHQLNKADRKAEHQLSGNHENVNGLDIPSQTDKYTDMEGQSETILNEPTHNDRVSSGDTGSVSTGNALNDILKGLDQAIQKANAIEQAEANRQAKELERKMNKPKTKSHSKSRGHEPSL